ncbi:MAG: hypothetical protein NPIRA05_13630 [Nitrospirales bacterium]|nr:MAG: hypothetical protein NPIRA05_13630 [Nitrospirales bacterium]
MNSIHHQHSTSMSPKVAVIGALVLALSGAVSHAETYCYDFSNFASTGYEVGDTISTAHGDINLLEVFDENGNPMQPNPNGLTSHNNVPIPGQGENPSLFNHGGFTIQVVPNSRMSAVTLKFAENTGSTDQQLWNFGVNNERQIWRGQLSTLDGQSLGESTYGGRVRIAVGGVVDTDPNSYWVRGMVTLASDPVNPGLPDRGIDRFSIGRSSQLLIDDVCMTE